MPQRYLLDFDSSSLKQEKYDVIIVGSGIAGLYAALNLHGVLSVCVLSKQEMSKNNSYLAQGGIAAAVTEDDMPEYHYNDTIKAGAGHCSEEAVRLMVNEAPVDIQVLCNIGTDFDRNPDGTLTTTREGGHGRFRVVHAHGDATGKEVVDSLLAECKKRANIKIIENCFAIDILSQEGGVSGVLIMPKEEKAGNRSLQVLWSKAVIIASGGIGQVYRNTTNEDIITGDGIAMAYRAGAELIDMEFVQFHPTALYNKDSSKSSFLITEAVRGEGGILRNITGEPFMSRYHEMAEIAPRDIVSRAIFSEMKKTGSDYVYLDITHKDREHLKKRFPTVFERCLSEGIDMSKDLIPVVPVQHYFMGGIKTDLWGRTSLEGLYSCGEAACTGVHGANRLASNSLLEGLVFGRRSAEHINSRINDMSFYGKHFEYKRKSKSKYSFISETRSEIQLLMDRFAGIERNYNDMMTALEKIEVYISRLEAASLRKVYELETLNIAYIASIILKSAIARKESLGSHYRVD
ncbi:MAG: L-aspartate oxidase [Bacillota bacterium]